MILNNRNSSFIFEFPKEFFAPSIEAKYAPYYKSLILPYDSVSDFMSSMIQQISIPGWSMTPATQTLIYGKQRDMKNSKQIQDLYNREFTVTFKLTDAFLNYIIMKETLEAFLDFQNDTMVFPPFFIVLLDSTGKGIMKYEFKKPIPISLSELQLSYSSNIPQFNTFAVSFKYFESETKLLID